MGTLRHLEGLAAATRGEDRKWQELARVLEDKIFTSHRLAFVANEGETAYAHEVPEPQPSPHQKLVIFTEHRDTLTYLQRKVMSMLGPSAVVVIHGGMGREDRTKAQEAFRHDPTVQVLVATDAAGEGINLQRAHLMVNYDLPWNPNRLEQRFGRIHRIGQTEVCYLWNIIAGETREGDVYQTLLLKLEEARKTLGGQVFDVLGKLQFEGKPLRELLIEAIRYGELPEVRGSLDRPRRRERRGPRTRSGPTRRNGRWPTTPWNVSRVSAHTRGHGARRGPPTSTPLRGILLSRGSLQRGLEERSASGRSARYEVTHVPAPVRPIVTVPPASASPSWRGTSG